MTDILLIYSGIAITSKCLPNEVSTLLTYNMAGKLETLKNLDSDGNIRDEYTYSSDPCGNRTEIVRTSYDDSGYFVEGLSYKVNYSYDALNQLIGTDINDLPARRYYYDSLGNRLIKQDFVKNETEINTYNALNQLITTEVNKSTLKRYEYDLRGNLSKIIIDNTVDASLSFDYRNMLIEIRKLDCVSNFGYNGFGNRIFTGYNTGGIICEREFVHDVTKPYQNVICTYDGMGNFVDYILGRELIGTTNGISNLYYQHDELGSAIRLTDDNGSTVETYGYDEFGTPFDKSKLDVVRGEVNDIGFTGYAFEPMADLYYAEARHYSPKSGRFISEDPIRSGLNWYAYCSNNPIRFVDPSGLTALTDRDKFLFQKHDVDLKYFDELDKLRDGLEWYTKFKSLYSTSDAFGKILNYNDTITSVSEQLSVPKSMIQAVLFRELICIGYEDILADALVHLRLRDDSSVGLGQIQASTAIRAHNPDTLGLNDMWNLLQNPQKNIEYIGHVLRLEAKQQGIEELYSINDEQLINIFGAYNAGENFNTAGVRYGNATKSYYDFFEKFNICE